MNFFQNNFTVYLCMCLHGDILCKYLNVLITRAFTCFCSDVTDFFLFSHSIAESIPMMHACICKSIGIICFWKLYFSIILGNLSTMIKFIKRWATWYFKYNLSIIHTGQYLTYFNSFLNIYLKHINRINAFQLCGKLNDIICTENALLNKWTSAGVVLI